MKFSIKAILQCFSGAMYIILGFFIFSKGWFVIQLEPIYSYILSAVFVLYGGFRIWRGFTGAKEDKNNL